MGLVMAMAGVMAMDITEAGIMEAADIMVAATGMAEVMATAAKMQMFDS